MNLKELNNHKGLKNSFETSIVNTSNNLQSSRMKLISLICLVFQNTSLVLLMRATRSQRAGPMYFASTSVVIMEIVKIVCSFSVYAYQKGSRINGVGDLVNLLVNLMVGGGSDSLKMLVPACLYAVQNNLLFLAITYLDAVTFQVTYQLKILTTAVFSVIMLKRTFGPVKWISLVLLTIGVAFVQWPAESPKSTAEALTSRKSASDGTIGFLAVISACMSSGFAGVYFEKTIKKVDSNLWARNVQLGIFSLFFSLLTCFVSDGRSISERGFFYGYNYMVAMVILLQAAGGLIVALVVKYADNILKAFATSISIIVSMLFSMIWYDFHPSYLFMAGISLVFASVYFYSLPELEALRHDTDSRNIPISYLPVAIDKTGSVVK